MEITNLSVLVTGGAGFIGSNIVEYLLKNNVKKVRVIDNLSTGNKNNLQPFLEKYDNLEFMYGDISKLEDCRKAVNGMDVITNQAALGSVPRSINDPLSSHISNVNGFLNILITAKEEGIKRVVYASSSSVYGDHPVLPKLKKIQAMFFHHMRLQRQLMNCMQEYFQNVTKWSVSDFGILMFLVHDKIQMEHMLQ